LVSLIWAAVKVPLDRSIRTGVMPYMVMADTKGLWGLAMRIGPSTSMFAINVNEVSVLWGPRGTTIQIPFLYYLLRGPRPSYTRHDVSLRMELGCSIEFAHGRATYYGLFFGISQMYRYLVVNLGPR